MEAFARDELDGSLEQVPGIGPAAVQNLNEHGIYNSFQLLGQYLKLSELEKDEDDGETRIDTYSLNQRFWMFLQDSGVNSHRSAIVKAINAKLGSLLPPFLDANVYEDVVEEEENK